MPYLFLVKVILSNYGREGVWLYKILRRCRNDDFLQVAFTCMYNPVFFLVPVIAFRIDANNGEPWHSGRDGLASMPLLFASEQFRVALALAEFCNLLVAGLQLCLLIVCKIC